MARHCGIGRRHAMPPLMARDGGGLRGRPPASTPARLCALTSNHVIVYIALESSSCAGRIPSCRLDHLRARLHHWAETTFRFISAGSAAKRAERPRGALLQT
ncbi:hypothetical protein V2G26_009130 [Clonostachys chloroleuca]